MKPESKNPTSTVAFRIDKEIRSHYERQAEKEQRKLSQILRLIIEGHYRGSGKRKKAA